jgi:hypothetical protein
MAEIMRVELRGVGEQNKLNEENIRICERIVETNAH